LSLPENTHAKFEVRGFYRFGSIGIQRPKMSGVT